MELDGKPKVGMEFDNLESAWKFLRSYGGKMGFGVRKDFFNKSKKDGAITSCRFVCSKEGVRRKDKSDYLTVNPRQETRTDCKARIVLRRVNEKLRVKEFVEEHHHNSANPLFFHKFQMDSDEQITNIFWADVRMQLDYAYFGDVVSLDTTYCTNNAHRPLALFSGFNHHRGVVIFGAALLYDETAASFKWLFEMFLKVHNQKKPQTIFTDQDRAMAKGLQEVLPDTYHRLCTWHLMQNCIKHLGNLMKHGSHFLRDFKACMYEYEEEKEFEEAWNVKRCLNPDVDIIQFFKHFERVQLAEVYTPIILDMFQDQFDLFSACCIKQRRQMFEANDVKLVPDQYILKRWTKMARTGIIFDVNGNEVEEDPKFGHTLEIRSLCQRFVKLASEVTGKDEVLILRSATDEVIKKVEALRLGKIHGTNESDDPIIPSSNDMSIPTGIKKRVGIKRRSRPKSRVELQLRNRKASRSRSHPTVTHSQSESTDIGASSQVQLENSFSFTRLLMDQSEGSVSLGALEFGGDKL
ncbi:protein FAR1-RELATED SEQUENCE 5-like [Senna tora]|uniref:Protein FAR1-RELATED SEQUENCE 5-like n=1 Tax=Senna tora TaxID=362788 RepID=A0A834WJW6_9FABA|nr:protein FAR1-RELATED SEQUENCE 5-like [Senna tora]